MSDDLPDQFVVQRKADTSVYHTEHCIAIDRTSVDEATPISDETVEWHDLDLCSYCDPSTEIATVVNE